MVNVYFFFQAEDGIRDHCVTGVQTCALPISDKITCLTAYDYPTARLLDEAGVDVILVGDSVGMVALGYESTLPVTLEDILHHTRAVRRGTRRDRKSVV